MSPLPDAELERLLVDLESDRVERKESFKGNAPTSVREAVCAFANDLPGHRAAGIVFVGARDDGTPAELVVSDRPFDVRPVHTATLDDVDRRRFTDEYLSQAVAPDVLAVNDRTDEQQLAASKMVWTADEPVPTVLGILVLCPRARDFLPGAYIQFLRIAGRDLADPVIDEAAIDGTVADVLRRIDEKLASHNRVGVDIATGTTERRTSQYPLVALQQLVRNAVLHRSYEATHAPVRATWYDDRIEIANPGGPFGSVTEANFGDPGVTDYRNPNLAEALRVLGFVQRFGVGIAPARKVLAENGNPAPEFEVRPEVVNVVVRARA